MGYVYLVEAIGTDLFKIGKATDIRNRVKSLQTGCPYRLRLVNCCQCPEPMLLENELHRLFDEYRQVGEWFLLPYDAVKRCVTLLSISNEVIEPDPIPAATIRSLEALLDGGDPSISMEEIERVIQLHRMGYSQNKIIELVWGIPKSGTSTKYQLCRTKYRQALEELGEKQPETPNQQQWETLKQIRQLIASGVKAKRKIIPMVWGVSPGGSDAYRQASAEYDFLMQFLPEIGE